MKAPNEVSGLVEWWDPDDLSGSRVTSWEGKNGYTLTGGPVGGEPLLIAASKQPSNHQTVFYDRNGDGNAVELRITDVAFDLGTATYAFLLYPPGIVNGYPFNKKATNPSAASLRAEPVTSAYRPQVRLASAPSGSVTVDATDFDQPARPQVIVWRHDGSELILRVNGTEVASTSASGPMDTTAGPLVIGNHPDSPSLIPPGWVFGDFCVFDGTVSDADVAELEAWFSDRWGLGDEYADWTTLPPVVRASPSTGEGQLFSPTICELDDDTWVMFACIEDSATGDMRWVDYWTSPKSDPHTWTRNPGSPIIDAVTDSPPSCRVMGAVNDAGTFHILVDSSGNWYHFTGSDLSTLTDNGLVYSGAGSGWNRYVRHPNILPDQVAGEWVIYFDARVDNPQGEAGSIGVVYTEDFVTFTGATEVLTPSGLWWEDDDVGAPAVRVADGVWQMLYAGYTAAVGIPYPHYFGVATSFDGLTWQKNSKHVPVLVPIRNFGSYRINSPEWFHDGTDLYVYYGNLAPGEDILSVRASSALLQAITPGAVSASCSTAAPSATCSTPSPSIACTISA